MCSPSTPVNQDSVLSSPPPIHVERQRTRVVNRRRDGQRPQSARNLYETSFRHIIVSDGTQEDSFDEIDLSDEPIMMPTPPGAPNRVRQRSRVDGNEENFPRRSLTQEFVAGLTMSELIQELENPSWLGDDDLTNRNLMTTYGHRLPSRFGRAGSRRVVATQSVNQTYLR